MAKLAVFPLRVFTTSGTLASGVNFTLQGYEAGTSTPKDFYTDSTGATAYANPYTLPASGTVAVWLGEGAYKFDLKDSLGVSQAGYPIDNVQGIDTSIEVASIAELKNLTAGESDYVYVGGYTSNGDGGEGTFYWDGDANDIGGFADNGGTIIKPNSDPINGRWLRNTSPRLMKPEWFGAVGDGSTNDYAAIQAAIDALPSGGGGVVEFSNRYAHETEISVNKRGVTLRGVWTAGEVNGAADIDSMPELLYTGTQDDTASNIKVEAFSHNFSCDSLFLNSNDLCGFGLYQVGIGPPGGAVLTRGSSVDNITFRGYRKKAWVIGDDTETPNFAQFQLVSAKNIYMRGGADSLEADGLHVNAQNLEFITINGFYIDPRSSEDRHHRHHIRQVLGGINILGLLSTRAGSGEGFYQVNGAGQDGSSINVDTGTKGYRAGLKIRFANVNSFTTGDPMTFTLTADFAGGAGALQISPSIITSGGSQNVDAGPADGASILEMGSYAISSRDQLMITGWRSEDRFLLDQDSVGATSPSIISSIAQRPADPEAGDGKNPTNASDEVIRINQADVPTTLINPSVNGTINIGATSDIRASIIGFNPIRTGATITYGGPQNSSGIFHKIDTGDYLLKGSDTNFEIQDETGDRHFALDKKDLYFPRVNDSQITASVNDYDIGDGTFIRLSSDSNWNITGIANGASGRHIIVCQTSAFTLTLKNNDGTSSAANRILSATGSDIPLAQNECAALYWDISSNRWRAWKLGNPYPSTVVGLGDSIAGTIFKTATSGLNVRGVTGSSYDSTWRSAGDVNLIANRTGTNIVTIEALSENSAIATVTANVTQTQGQTPLTKNQVVVSTVANANDVVTLMDAQPGGWVYIKNKGANTLQIFPATGDNIDDTGVNSSVTLAAGSSITYRVMDSTNWYS